MKMDKRAIEKMEKELQKNMQKAFDKEAKKNPITSDDSPKKIEEKLKKMVKSAGAKPDAAGIKKQAKEIHKDLDGK